ncbi:hypothetical protein RI367_006550 [Sorochytrium milnesiophthora]
MPRRYALHVLPVLLLVLLAPFRLQKRGGGMLVEAAAAGSVPFRLPVTNLFDRLVSSDDAAQAPPLSRKWWRPDTGNDFSVAQANNSTAVSAQMSTVTVTTTVTSTTVLATTTVTSPTRAAETTGGAGQQTTTAVAVVVNTITSPSSPPTPLPVNVVVIDPLAAAARSQATHRNRQPADYNPADVLARAPRLYDPAATAARRAADRTHAAVHKRGVPVAQTPAGHHDDDDEEAAAWEFASDAAQLPTGLLH